MLLNVFAHELHEQGGKGIQSGEIFNAVDRLHERCRGAYSVIALISGKGVLGFRDPRGIRPVVIGFRDTDKGREYAIASESVALDVLDFKLMRDLKPGEAVFITTDGELHSHESPLAQPALSMYIRICLFCRPDSMLDDISVYKARLRMGQALARKILRDWPEHDIDVVIPVPDTSRTAALPLAYDLDVKYREGFIKNRYIGRTFIMPGQEAAKTLGTAQTECRSDLEFRGIRMSSWWMIRLSGVRLHVRLFKWPGKRVPGKCILLRPRHRCVLPEYLRHRYAGARPS